MKPTFFQERFLIHFTDAETPSTQSEESVDSPEEQEPTPEQPITTVEADVSDAKQKSEVVLQRVQAPQTPEQIEAAEELAEKLQKFQEDLTNRLKSFSPVYDNVSISFNANNGTMSFVTDSEHINQLQLLESHTKGRYMKPDSSKPGVLVLEVYEKHPEHGYLGKRPVDAPPPTETGVDNPYKAVDPSQVINFENSTESATETTEKTQEQIAADIVAKFGEMKDTLAMYEGNTEVAGQQLLIEINGLVSQIDDISVQEDIKALRHEFADGTVLKFGYGEGDVFVFESATNEAPTPNEDASDTTADVVPAIPVEQTPEAEPKPETNLEDIENITDTAANGADSAPEQGEQLLTPEQLAEKLELMEEFEQKLEQRLDSFDPTYYGVSIKVDPETADLIFSGTVEKLKMIMKHTEGRNMSPRLDEENSVLILSIETYDDERGYLGRPNENGELPTPAETGANNPLSANTLEGLNETLTSANAKAITAEQAESIAKDTQKIVEDVQAQPEITAEDQANVDASIDAAAKIGAENAELTPEMNEVMQDLETLKNGASAKNAAKEQAAKGSEAAPESPEGDLFGAPTENADATNEAAPEAAEAESTLTERQERVKGELATHIDAGGKNIDSYIAEKTEAKNETLNRSNDRIAQLTERSEQDDERLTELQAQESKLEESLANTTNKDAQEDIERDLERTQRDIDTLIEDIEQDDAELAAEKEAVANVEADFEADITAINQVAENAEQEKANQDEVLQNIKENVEKLNDESLTTLFEGMSFEVDTKLNVQLTLTAKAIEALQTLGKATKVTTDIEFTEGLVQNQEGFYAHVIAVLRAYLPILQDQKEQEPSDSKDPFGTGEPGVAAPGGNNGNTTGKPNDDSTKDIPLEEPDEDTSKTPDKGDKEQPDTAPDVVDETLPPAEDAPVGQIRQDRDGNHWIKQEDGM